ncbi:MAG: hypothetical protein ACLU1W_05360 [Collinsella sp.]
MGSKKRAAWSKAKSEFLGAATGGDMGDLFAREDERRDALDAKRDEAWRYKSCERKNRYDTRAEAEAVMADAKSWASRPGLLQMRVLRRLAPDVASLEIGRAAPAR